MLYVNNIVKNSDKSKYVHTDYAIAFDGAGSWSFGNGYARNIVIFGVDYSLSSYTHNRPNNFLALGDGSIDDINGSVNAAGKELVLTLVRQKQNFAWVCIIMVVVVIYLLTE